MRARRSLALAAAAALPLAVAMAPAAMAAPTPDPAKTYVVDCGGALKVKPKTIVLACGDGGVFLSKITWSSWDATGATGTGTLRVNVCQPTCAAGNVDTYRKVRLSLGQVATNGALSAFTSMTGSFAGSGGPAMANQVTWQLGNEAR